jgi:hypothetical protein
MKAKSTLKEYTDENFSGAQLIASVKAKKPDAQGMKFIQKHFPNGFKSQQKAEKALKDSDASPIKARMGRYAPMFVHVQSTDFKDEAGQLYAVHQRQYYNSNFKEQDPKFNPSVTKLLVYKKKDASDPNSKDENYGEILVKTEEYIKDLQKLRSTRTVSEGKMTKTESIIKRLKEDSAYQEFFQKAMKKFDISSPTDLKDPEKKKNFFNYVDNNYKAKSEGKIKEAYFPAHGEDSAELKRAKTALANWFKTSIETGMQNKPLGRKTFDILNDLIEDYAYEYAQDWASGNMK